MGSRYVFCEFFENFTTCIFCETHLLLRHNFRNHVRNFVPHTAPYHRPTQPHTHTTPTHGAKFLEFLIVNGDTNKLDFYAKEAALNLNDIINQIELRRKYIKKFEDKQLSSFLVNQFDPLIEKFRTNFDLGQDFSNYLFCSPSDVGLHNALVKKNGSLIFFDFEYAGICSLPKLFGDLKYHPGSKLNSAQSNLVIDQLSKNIKLNEIFPSCILAIGLKWVLLALNEYNPTIYKRRLSASQNVKSFERVKYIQLEKAKVILNDCRDKLI